LFTFAETVVEKSFIPIKGGTMPKPKKRRQKPKGQPQSETLKGWKEISEFLGEPVSVVKRWAEDGMPLNREGQFVSTSSDELNAWLGQDSGKPVHVATENTDLTAELKRGLSFVRSKKTDRPRKKLSALARKAKP
jgi:hypothetical protein